MLPPRRTIRPTPTGPPGLTRSKPFRSTAATIPPGSTTRPATTTSRPIRRTSCWPTTRATRSPTPSRPPVSATAHAFANGGGMDKAWLYDSSGNDSFVAYPTYAYLSNTTAGPGVLQSGQLLRPSGCHGQRRRPTSPGCTTRRARRFTSSASPTECHADRERVRNQAQNFRYVTAYATTGDDEAHLTAPVATTSSTVAGALRGCTMLRWRRTCSIAEFPEGGRVRQHGHKLANPRQTNRLCPDVLRHLDRRPVAVIGTGGIALLLFGGDGGGRRRPADCPVLGRRGPWSILPALPGPGCPGNALQSTPWHPCGHDRIETGGDCLYV